VSPLGEGHLGQQVLREANKLRLLKGGFRADAVAERARRLALPMLARDPLHDLQRCREWPRLIGLLMTQDLMRYNKTTEKI